MRGQISQAVLSAMDLTDVLLRFIGYRLKFWANQQSFDNFGRGWTVHGADNLLFASQDNQVDTPDRWKNRRKMSWLVMIAGLLFSFLFLVKDAVLLSPPPEATFQSNLISFFFPNQPERIRLQPMPAPDTSKSKL